MKVFNLLIRDIRFWIILFFIIRLWGITNAPLEVAHNWRQTTVTMVARNFLEIDNNIFFPRIDIAGNKTGITGMEFPILNYLIYLLSEIFGYQHWYGRLINLVFSSIGLFYFFKLIKKYFTQSIAFNSTYILLFSLWFAYSRKIMPDTFSVSFIIISLYYGSNYLFSKTKFNSAKNLLIYGLFASLGMLSKLPSGYLLILFLIPFANRAITLKKKLLFSLVSTIVLLPVSIWYFYWVPHLVEQYGFWHFFMGKSFTEGFVDILNNFPLTLKRFYDTALKYVGFTMFIVGLIIAIIKKEKLVLTILTLSFGAFLLIIFRAGFTFSHHSYYIIPFVPVMALIAGFGLDQINKTKFSFIIFLLIALEGILNQQHDFRIKDNALPILKLEQTLDSFSKPNDLILINSGEFPTPMYFAHRKGWVAYNKDIQNKIFLVQMKKEGCKYIVILKQVFGEAIKLDLELKFNNDSYAIYKL